MKALSQEELREICPVKWHDRIPSDGISLGVADVDFHGPEGVIEHLQDNLREEFSFYQDQQGLVEAVNAAQAYLQERGINSRTDQIQIIEGTMMGIYISMKWISDKPGDLLVLGPIYQPIHRHASSTGNTLHWTPITEDGLDYEDIKEQVSTKDIKMIVMCNPTNPIGYVFSDEDMQFLSNLVEQHDLYVFSDELYEPLWFDREHRSIASYEGMADRSILLYGFSKAYGLAGYRAGFMHIGPAPLEVRFIASQQMVSPSPISSLVTKYALTDPRARSWVQTFRSASRETTRYAAERFQQAGYSCRIPMGCFFVFPDLRVDDEQFCEFLLDKYGVQVVPGSNFGSTGRNHVRINCATSMERLAEGIDRILDAVEKFDNEKK